MKFEITKKRDHEELTVELNSKFVIEYEGSSEWLQALEDFINEKAI